VIGGHVGFHAEDRFDAGLGAFAEEFDDAEHAAVVGDGDAVHAEGFDPVTEFGDFAGPVEEGVMRVSVKMNERASGHGWIVWRGKRTVKKVKFFVRNVVSDRDEIAGSP